MNVINKKAERVVKELMDFLIVDEKGFSEKEKKTISDAILLIVLPQVGDIPYLCECTPTITILDEPYVSYWGGKEK